MIIGADAYGDKDFLGIVDGFYENTASQRNFLQSLKNRGRRLRWIWPVGTVLKAVARQHVHPNTTEQRCWVHKMVNTSGAIPQPLNAKVKAGWQEICMAATRQKVIVAFDLLVKILGMTYQRAVKR